MRATRPPAVGLYGSDGHRKYLTQAERQRFMRAAWLSCDPHVAGFCLVLAFCGCRISEALAVRMCDINVEASFVSFRSLKKRGAVVVREVPIPSYFAHALVQLLEDGPSSESRVWSWSRSRAWQIVKATTIEAGIAPGPHQTAKGLRHAFALNAIHSGVPLNMVQRWLGHASIETTSIYAQALGPEERDLAERMWR